MSNFRLLKVILMVGMTTNFCTVHAAEGQPKAEVTKVAEGVYGVFLMHYNSLVVVGKDGVAITDPANAYRASLLKKEVSKITNKPVTHVILTHEHYDHVGGTEVFQGAEIYCQVLCSNVLELDVRGVSPVSKVLTFDTYQKIDLGGQLIELHYFGVSDGIANSVVYLPKHKVVFTADLYDGVNALLPSFVAMDSVNLLGVRKVMKQLLAMDVDYALDAHSSSTDPDQLRRYDAFVEDVYQVTNDWIVSTLKNEGVPALMRGSKGFSESVELPQYKDWQNYDALHVYVHRMILAIFHGG